MVEGAVVLTISSWVCIKNKQIQRLPVIGQPLEEDAMLQGYYRNEDFFVRSGVPRSSAEAYCSGTPHKL